MEINMWWIIGFSVLIVVSLICWMPEIRFYIGLVRQAIAEGRNRKPPLAGA
jgi:hypothetical protein